MGFMLVNPIGVIGPK